MTLNLCWAGTPLAALGYPDPCWWSTDQTLGSPNATALLRADLPVNSTWYVRIRGDPLGRLAGTVFTVSEPLASTNQSGASAPPVLTVLPSTPSWGICNSAAPLPSPPPAPPPKPPPALAGKPGGRRALLQGTGPPPGMVQWLDAQNTSTITMSASKAVSAWADASGGSGGMTATTGSQSTPTYNQYQLGGNPAIIFTGSQMIGVTPMKKSSSVTLAIVFSALGDQSGNVVSNPGGVVWGHCNSTASAGVWGCDLDITLRFDLAPLPPSAPTSNQLNWHTASNTQTCDQTAVSNTPAVLIATMQNGASLYFEQTLTTTGAKTTSVTATVSPTIVTTDAQLIQLGAASYNMAFPAMGMTPQLLSAPGAIGEVIYYQSVLASAQLSALRSYLLAKWSPSSAGRVVSMFSVPPTPYLSANTGIVANGPGLPSLLSGTYTASASSTYTQTGYQPYLAFNGQWGSSDPNIWCSSASYNNGNGNYRGQVQTGALSGEYLQLTLPTAMTLMSYRLNTRGDPSYFLAPTAWTVLGSNDLVNWATFETRSSQSWSPSQNVSSTSVPLATPYSTYRIVITSSGGNVACIAEWQLSVSLAGAPSAGAAPQTAASPSPPCPTAFWTKFICLLYQID